MGGEERGMRAMMPRPDNHSRCTEFEGGRGACAPPTRPRALARSFASLKRWNRPLLSWARNGNRMESIRKERNRNGVEGKWNGIEWNGMGWNHFKQTYEDAPHGAWCAACWWFFPNRAPKMRCAARRAKDAR